MSYALNKFRFAMPKRIKSPVAACALAAMTLLGGCATTNGPATSSIDDVNDPYEATNRQIFAFNMAADKYVLRPIAEGYRFILPEFLRDMVSNFLDNLNSPVVFANDLLQGEPERAGNTLLRFGVNTVWGIGGLFDIAGIEGYEGHDEDFGQTLATWGVGEGPYIVLPLLGPSNPRDVGGLVGDTLMDPFFWWTLEIDHPEYNYIRGGVDAVNLRSQAIEILDDVQANSVDFYASMRSLYRQRRNDAIRNGETDPNEDVPDLDWDLPSTPISGDPQENNNAAALDDQ